MKRRFFLGALLLILASTILFVACQKKEEAAPEAKVEKKAEPVELTLFYYKDTIVDGMNALADAFMAKNPNVTIENEMLTTEFNTVLKSRDAAGQLPDMWATTPGETALGPYVDSGKVQPVDSLKVIKQLSPEFRESITFSDGKAWVIPFLTTARGLIYNSELFKEAGISTFPKTIGEMKDAVAKLNDAGITPFAGAWKDGWTVGSLVYQVGADVLDTPDFPARMSAGDASHKEFMEIFEFIDLFKNNCQPKAMDTDFMGSVSLYAQEKAAMIIQGPWAADAMMELAPDVVAKSKMVAIPYAKDPKLNKLYFDYDVYWAVSADADLETVDAYMDFIINGEGRKIFEEQIASLNPYGISFESHAVNKSILDAVDAGEIMGDTQYVNSPTDGWWQTQAIVMQEYLSGKINKEQMMEKLDKEWLAAANQ
jgi:raffinose/stachyose/melibiose transport system substrate-binding protein